MVSRRQALGAGLPPSTIASKVKHGLWQTVYPGVYYTFTGEIPWEARRWAAVLYAGPGALLSHETPAEILGLTNRGSPVIHVAVPSSRRVKAPPGVKVHYASFGYPRWPTQYGVPPHAFYAETVIDLVAAADNLDEVVAWVSRGIAKRHVSGTQLKMTARARRRFRWRGQLGEIIDQVVGGSHFPLEFRYDRDVARAQLRRPTAGWPKPGRATPGNPVARPMGVCGSLCGRSPGARGRSAGHHLAPVASNSSTRCLMSARHRSAGTGRL